MIAGGELDSDDDKSLLQHADEWDAYADTAVPEGLKQSCRRVAKQFRLEHETGVKHCMCCLKPKGNCRYDERTVNT